MTMPHLMNCPHTDVGWCPDCVKQEADTHHDDMMAMDESIDVLRKELVKVRAILQSNWDICENHDISVPGGECWVCNTLAKGRS